MLQKPQFKAHLHVEIVRDEGVFLISEVGHSVLNGHLFQLVAPLIDGRRSADEIVEELQDQASAAEVYYALTRLEQEGYISESDQSFSANEASLWAIQDVAPHTAARLLAEQSVSVTAIGDFVIKPFVSLLESLHVRVTEVGSLGIVLADDYLRKELKNYNVNALRNGRPWMLTKPVGRQILIGPVFYPGQTACWECLAQRLRLNRTVELFVQRKQCRDEPFPISRAATHATQQIAYGIAATEVTKWLVGAPKSYSEPQVLSVDVLSWQTEFHTLTRQPQCAACGHAVYHPERQPEPVVIESRRKTFIEDGGHRVMEPDETLRNYERHLSPITGVVSSLQPVEVPNPGVIHVYMAGDNFATQHSSLGHLARSLRSRNSGKGMTDLQARASGLCEALERYSGGFQGTEIRRKAKLKELDGLGIHPNDCMRFSGQQYAQREAINARHELRFNYVPLPFDEDAEIEWTPVWSLTHKIHRYVPTEYCYYGYPSPWDQRRCVCCSNGSAAGNTLEEAILQGFLELVERDSAALWWYNRVRRPSVALASFEEPYLAKLEGYLKERRFGLWALDLTSDLGIPVFAALSRRIDYPEEQIMIGLGAHLDPRIAVLRAVTELNQMLVLLFRSEKITKEALESFGDASLWSWLKTATVANQPYLVPDDNVYPREASSYPRQWTEDLRDDVRLCQDLVERRGMEILVLDQTRPDIGLSVVKVIVPGLRHFWPRFAAGRLYDVPVALGWLSKPVSENQLNPVPFFL
jgi:ribosomal protein S12 methylthiotransferase accessory factor